MEEIADVVCEAGIPEFEQLAPPNPQKSLPTDLSSFLYPESFYFQLVTIEGRAQIVRKDHPAPEGQLCPLETAASTLPTFAMGEIQVLQTFRGRHITKVLVKGQERCCKISSNMTQSAVQREFDCPSQVMAADAGNLMSVPKLVGLVRAPSNNHNDQVVGIIEDFIQSRPGSSTLRSINGQNVSESQKAKWIDQADNVLMDADDDAWLIDFGGGWTKGWVDENLAGTLEGDMQAVGKIQDFLGVRK
ncbi:uncharacterized protein RAG0_01781 [Rhynchosporium agropyri]|uniref:Uncharacterized protein n=1 Tax=Rhynchosporium agropyri TaxID=914238 RepID=A0A1E1JYK6_9HELO|nr:uncharacterized protein RAG0_01781 [Rhynchosporium agropyri]